MLLRSVAVVVLASGLAAAQVPAPQDAPRFDVVSIRLDTQSVMLDNQREMPGGGFTLQKGSVANLIRRAYRLDLKGLPAWAEKEVYDVVAQASLDRPSDEVRRAMQRALLAERFKLVAHTETQEAPAFDLVLARSDRRLGPGLVTHDVDCQALFLAQRAAEAGAPAGAPILKSDQGPQCTARLSRTGISGQMGMPLLASMLTSAAGRPVVDKTGLAATYRVTLEFDVSGGLATNPGATANLPTVFAALPEQLGLRLQPSKTQVEVLVIDRLERPTAN